MAKEKFQDPLENDQPFLFPMALLHQINECSPSGFLLFYIDDSGVPQTRAAFDAPINEIGLCSHALKFLQGVDKVEKAGIEQALRQEQENQEEEEE